MLDGRDHEVANIFALDALGGGDMAHGLAIATVEREGDPDLVAIVASDLEAVRTPSQVRLIDADAPVMTAIAAASMPFEQQIVGLHDTVDPLVIWGRTAFGLRIAA